jgi:hypothetical protein
MEAAVTFELRCSGCARIPLLGESATLHARGKRESWLCDICERDPRRSAAAGEAMQRVVIRSSGASNVRRVAR